MALVTKPWSPPVLSLGTGSYGATEVYEVSGVSDESSAIAAMVSAYPETAFNHVHPLNSYMYCKGHNVSVNTIGFYRIEVPYESTPAGRWSDPGNPLAEPTVYRWEQVTLSVDSDRDSNNNLLTNMAGEPFASSPQTPVVAIRIYAERNEAYFQASTALSYANSVNNSAVSYNSGQWSVQKGQSKVLAIAPLSEITSAAPYVRVQYVIELQRGYVQDSDGYWDPYKLRIVNAGRRGWYTASGATKRGNIVEIVGGQMQAAQHDVLLDKNGKPLQSEYKIAGLDGSINSPVANPSTPIFVTETTSAGVVFIKAFPQTVALLDHNSLSL